MSVYTLTQQDDTLLTKSVFEDYEINKYVKSQLSSENVGSLGLYRSVIVSNNPTNKGQVLCFSPPKSVSYSDFISRHSPEECVAEEFIEGTMINVFWDTLANKWVLSTKSKINANCVFYKVPPYEKDKIKSFYDMFLEACLYCQFNYNDLDKNLCYSFVFRHPDNRIVIEVVEPIVYLVAAYKIHNTTGNETKIEQINVSMPNLTFRQQFEGFKGTGVCVPQQYNYSSFTELEDRHTSNSTPYNILGFIVKHLASGERAKKWNSNYLTVKSLRGNNPRLDYHYIELRKSGKVKDFLKYYPEFKTQFNLYRQKIHEFTNQLYRNYVDCYILKKNKLSYFASPYKSHMYSLHTIYLTEMKPQNAHITKQRVIDYVNQLSEALLLYCLKNSC
jgi:hypothetical protein